MHGRSTTGSAQLVLVNLMLSSSFVIAMLLWTWTHATAQEVPRGTIIDRIECAGDPAQTYALYLPSGYSPDRQWSVLLAFHPAARGRAMVEKYQGCAR